MTLKDFIIISVPIRGLFDHWDKALPPLVERVKVASYYDYAHATVLDLLKEVLPGRVLSPESGGQASCGMCFFRDGRELAAILGGDAPESVLNRPNDNTVHWLVIDPTDTFTFQRWVGSRFVVRKNNYPDYYKSFTQPTAALRRNLLGGEGEPLSFLVADGSPFAAAFWQPSDYRTGKEVFLQTGAARERAAAAGGDHVQGWIRPFIVRVPLDGEAVPPAYRAGIDAQAALFKLLLDPCLKYVQPIFPRNVGLRWCFLAAWWERLRTSGRRPTEWTALERLVFQPNRQTAPRPPGGFAHCPWYPFFVLDLLGGSWQISRFGTGTTAFLWLPPERFSANMQWFACHWIKRWGGEEGLASQRRAAIPAPPLPQTALRAGDGFRGPAERAAQFRGSILELLRGHPDARRLGELADFLEQVFARPELTEADGQLSPDARAIHQDYLWDGSGALRFSEKPFVETVCRQLLLLQSPLRVEFPRVHDLLRGGELPPPLQEVAATENEQLEKLSFDFLDSGAGHAERFLRQLVRTAAAPGRNVVQEATVRYCRHTWWLGEYIDLATSAAADVRITLAPDIPELQLGTGLLGWAHLGPGEQEFAGPAYNDIRFFT